MTYLQSNLWIGPDAHLKFASYDPFGKDIPVDPFAITLESLFRLEVANLSNELSKEEASDPKTMKRVIARLLAEHFGENFKEEIKGRSRNYIAAAYADGAETGDAKLRSLGASLEDVEKSRGKVQDALAQAVDRSIVRLSDGVGDTFKVRLRDIMGDGIEQGESMPDLSKRVREWAGANNDIARSTRSRSMMIARTETRRAQIDAQVTSWRATEIVQGKRWLLAPNPCQFCGAAAKTGVIPLDKPFYRLGQRIRGTKGGTMKLDYETIYGPALHPNCRCDLLPVPIKVKR